jgi:hypothetical protein
MLSSCIAQATGSVQGICPGMCPVDDSFTAGLLNLQVF